MRLADPMPASLDVTASSQPGLQRDAHGGELTRVLPGWLAKAPRAVFAQYCQ
jgi:hypothetical protein